MLNDYECDCFDLFELCSTVTHNTVLTQPCGHNFQFNSNANMPN